MSAALRNRIHRREEMLTCQISTTVLPATLLILTLAILIVVLGHFFPAG